MSYAESKRRVRRGDIEVARELIVEARAIKDSPTVLLCWSVMNPTRFRAWNALMATLRVVRLLPPIENQGVLSEVAAQTGATNQVRADIIARTLVSACQQVSDGQDPISDHLVTLAVGTLESDSTKLDDTSRSTLEDVLADALLTADEAVLTDLLFKASTIIGVDLVSAER